MGLNISKAPPFILEKINDLCRLLWKEKKVYEKVAATIPDKELCRTILTLAQESNQYACELSSQIQTLGGAAQQDEIWEPEMEIETQIFHDETEMLTFCKENEQRMVSAYREILNEPYLYEGLRKMIRYQLNGILCAFMQIKLLDSLKLH